MTEETETVRVVIRRPEVVPMADGRGGVAGYIVCQWDRERGEYVTLCEPQVSRDAADSFARKVARAQVAAAILGQLGGSLTRVLGDVPPMLTERRTDILPEVRAMARRAWIEDQDDERDETRGESAGESFKRELAELRDTLRGAK